MGNYKMLFGSKQVKSLAFSPDGKWIASGGIGVVEIWDAHSGKLKHTVRGGSNCVVFTPDSTRVIGCGEGRVWIWEVISGENLLSIQSEPKNPTCVAVSFDGTRICCGHQDGSITVWDSRMSKGMFGAVEFGFVEDEPGYENEPGYDSWRERAQRSQNISPVWHRQNAEQAEKDENWFAARFHLRCLLKYLPDDEDVQNRLRRAEVALQDESSEQE